MRTNTGKSVEKKVIRFINDDSITFAKGALLATRKRQEWNNYSGLTVPGVKRAFERIGNDYITNTDSIARLTAFVQ